MGVLELEGILVVRILWRLRLAGVFRKFIKSVMTTNLMAPNATASRKTKTSYFYSEDIGHYHYANWHPMKVLLHPFVKFILRFL